MTAPPPRSLLGESPRSFTRGAAIGVAVGSVASFGLGFGLAGSRDAPSSPAAAPASAAAGQTWFRPPTRQVVGGVSLPDVSTSGGGRPFRLAARRGGLLVVFFGYTYCPDICPLTLANLVSIKRKLGSESQRVSIAFITVDPRRDRPAKLNAYLGSFLPRFHALRTTSPAKLALAETAFGAQHRIVGNPNSSTYTIDHTATVFGVDDRGRIAIEWAHDAPATAIAGELRRLLAAAT